MKFDLNRAVNTLASNRILTQVLNQSHINILLFYSRIISCYKTAQLGLLTRLEKAGFTPSSAIPLLKLADKYDVVGILESSSDKVLPLVAKGIELAPQLLPLASKALKIPSSTLFVGAAASAAAAVGLLYVVPDDSVVNIALQTALFVPLGLVAPGGLAVGGIVLDKINGKGK